MPSKKLEKPTKIRIDNIDLRVNAGEHEKHNSGIR